MQKILTVIMTMAAFLATPAYASYFVSITDVAAPVSLPTVDPSKEKVVSAWTDFAGEINIKGNIFQQYSFRDTGLAYEAIYAVATVRNLDGSIYQSAIGRAGYMYIEFTPGYHDVDLTLGLGSYSSVILPVDGRSMSIPVSVSFDLILDEVPSGYYYTTDDITDESPMFFVPIDDLKVTSSLSYTLSVITEPIPEPATWSMMLVGFGAVGGVIRSRRRLAAPLRSGPFGCLIPGFDGALFTVSWKEALWARFSTGAPQRLRRSVERYSIVKRA